MFEKCFGQCLYDEYLIQLFQIYAGLFWNKEQKIPVMDISKESFYKLMF